tara:strand:+ start:902 stop:2191 length:1290 start_codon:yes stop_codon:yes gene_type:complete
MEPVLTREGSGYRVDWPSVGVHIIVRYIKRKLDSFKAECAVYYQGEPVHRSNPTLDSVTGMDQFRRKCQRSRPTEDYGINWDQIIEDLSGIVIDTARAGTPEAVLGDVPPDESVAWRVDNLLVEDTTVLWANGGTGKSFFALWLSTLISEGLEYVNTDHGLIVEPGNVLYLDYETTQAQIASRVRKLHNGLGIDRPSKIVYRHMELPLVQDVDTIRDIVHKRNIDYIVVDSMGLAVDGELESAAEVLEFFRSLNTIGLPSLVISHANKSGNLFGSAYTANAARSVIEGSNKEGSYATGGIEFNLFHRKANDIPKQAPQTWSVQFEPDKVTYTRGDVFHSGAAGELSYAKLVYNILEESSSPKTREYLTETIAPIKDISLEKAKPLVSTAITRNMNEGHALETDEGIVFSKKTPGQEGDDAWAGTDKLKL